MAGESRQAVLAAVAGNLAIAATQGSYPRIRRIYLDSAAIED
ncbi:MAG TPA: hypothetical protein VFA72_01230 [Burkholderiales bacterium]|nr:hypothetical protein [Burkholderiales bacterium]